MGCVADDCAKLEWSYSWMYEATVIFFNNELHEKARKFKGVVALTDEIACENCTRVYAKDRQPVKKIVFFRC